MRRWTHLLSGVAIAATVAHYAITVAVRRDQRTALEGWKSHDDPRSIGTPLPHGAGRPSERTAVSVIPHRELLLDSGVVGPKENALDRLRRSGVI